jgi:hypothetical protein
MLPAAVRLCVRVRSDRDEPGLGRFSAIFAHSVEGRHAGMQGLWRKARFSYFLEEFVMQKQWFLGCALAAALVACGKKEEPVAAAPAAPAAAAAPAEEKVLNIYNWPDYIAKDMVANLEKETGI